MDTSDNVLSSNVVKVPSEILSFVTQAGAIDVGSAIGTVVYSALSNNKVCDLLGIAIGEKSGSGVGTSIVFTTAVMDSTLEIAWDFSGNSFNAQKAAMITAIGLATAGTWACHYPTGLLIIKKKTTGVTQTITSYKIRTTNQGDPTVTTPVTPLDATDFTATASKGLHLSIASGSSITLVYRRLNDIADKTEIFSFDAYVWGPIKNVMTATTLNGNTIMALS